MLRKLSILFFCVISMLLLGAFRGFAAQIVARVDGDPITDEEVRYVAIVSLGVKEAELSKENREKALKQTIVNHKVAQIVQKKNPAIMGEVERAADLAVARDYFRAWMADFGQVEAMQTVTPLSIAEKMPLPEPLAFIYVIVMKSEEKLGEVRDDIVSGKITFEEAARKYSEGITAKRAGEVGGISPSDDRFSEAARKEIFGAPKGSVTKVFDETLGYSIYWIKDRLTPEEIRLRSAHEVLEDKIREEMNRLGWEASKKLAKETGSILYINDDNADEFEKAKDKPVMRISGRDYLVEDVLSRSGGKIHGKKDIITISENIFRDMMLQQLYVTAKGAKEQSQLRKKAMIEHLATRKYFNTMTADLEITDADIDEYIAQNRGKYDLPDRADLGVIFVKSEERRDTVMERLKTVDFDIVARAWTQHQRYIDGKMGIVPVSQAQGDLSNLKPGTVLPPQKMGEGEDEGWYILKVFRFFPAEPASRDNLSAQTIGGIRSILLARKREARLLGFVDGLVKDAKVEILM